MNTEQLIKSRHSVRSFTDQKIEGSVLSELQNTITECNKASELNIQLVLNEPDAFGQGHYGQFNNCRNYVAIVGSKDDKKLSEKSGYYGEKVVIKAQELGLNTCWVAMTYKKSKVPIDIKKNEKIVIVIAIGYGANQGVSHKIKAFHAVSKTLEADAPDWYKKGIEFALLAPTALNQQKFIFELKENNKVAAKAKFSPCAKIDLGIVKYHFELGAGIENFVWDE